MKSPIALLLNLLKDIKRLNPGVSGLDRDFETIERRILHEGYGFLTIALPTLDEALVRGLATRRFACPVGFKTIRGGVIPRFLSGILCKVFDAQTGSLIEPVEYGMLRDVHTFLKLCKKTQLQSDHEALLHEKAVEEFYSCDETAGQVDMPERKERHMSRVSRLILQSLHKKDLENENIYRHGPGAVCESYSANQKWSALSGELGNHAHLPEWFGHTNFRNLHNSQPFSAGSCVGGSLLCPTGQGKGPESSRYTPKQGGGSQTQVAQRRLSSRSKRVDRSPNGSRLQGIAIHESESLHCGDSARLISVLKNSTSRRTITIEPYLRQYLQQGLNTILRESITECVVLSNCLALTDQSKNQKLALEGSLHDNWATIDLKSASDLLSVKLVESVFRYHPVFFGMLMDSRSPKAHTTGLNRPEIDLRKFAGMGNATTFPVQSICFAVLGIAAILDEMGLVPTRKNVIAASHEIRVFGDDIIIRTDYAHRVVEWLTDAGLKVNIKKSFLEGNFKESCGVEAYKGVDITPLYLRYWPHQVGESPSVCAHLVSLSNHMWMQGLYSASNYLKETVEKEIGILPLVSSQSGSLGWHCRQDSVEPHKWCNRTHQFLTRTFALKPVKRRDRLDGYGALLKSLTTPLLGRGKDHLERTAKRFHNRLVRRWVPSLTSEGLNLQS